MKDPADHRMQRGPVVNLVLSGPETSMKKFVFATLLALTVGACTTTEERIGGAAVGAGVGAVAGPVGAVAGGAVGAATGPAVSRSVSQTTRRVRSQ
jgi:hypothetical protein